jgi:phage terminase large subunit
MSDINISHRYAPLFDIPLAWDMAKKNPDDKYWNDLAKVSIVIVTGGRFSVKSFAVSMTQVVWCSDYGYNILSTRYTNSSLEDSVIPEIQEKVELLDKEDDFHIVKNRAIHEPNGRKIVFKGLKASSKNQSANLKSLKDFSAWWVEEAEEHQNYDEWEKAYLSVRDVNRQVISGLVLNPASKEHWVHKKFFEDRGVPGGFNGIKDEVLYIHTTYKDCPKEFIPENIRQHFERGEQAYLKWKETPVKERDQLPSKIRSKAKWYEHVVLGGWLNKAEGVIFENWTYGDFPKDVDYGFGLDFGFSVDPDALTRVHIDKKHKKIYLKEELYRNGLGTEQLAYRLKNICEKKEIVADNAEQRLISDLKLKGLNIKPCKKGSGSIVEGIKIMQDYELIVDPDSTNIAKELNNYVCDDKKSEKPIDAYNHLLDGIRYYVTKNTKAYNLTPPIIRR